MEIFCKLSWRHSVNSRSSCSIWRNVIFFLTQNICGYLPISMATTTATDFTQVIFHPFRYSLLMFHSIGFFGFTVRSVGSVLCSVSNGNLFFFYLNIYCSSLPLNIYCNCDWENKESNRPDTSSIKFFIFNLLQQLIILIFINMTVNNIRSKMNDKIIIQLCQRIFCCCFKLLLDENKFALNNSISVLSFLLAFAFICKND